MERLKHMRITRTITINLSREEIAEIIKDYLSAEGFEVNEKNIEFKVESYYEGYGLESQMKQFTGCNVVCTLNGKDNE